MSHRHSIAGTSDEQSIIGLLRDNGFRITKARGAIIGVIASSHEPFTALEMYRTLRKLGLTADKVTVYRELQFLFEQGILRDVSFKDGVKRYENAAGGHHHHLICTNCHTVEDIHMEHDLDAIEKTIRRRTSFTILSHTLEFYGLCSRCA